MSDDFGRQADTYKPLRAFQLTVQEWLSNASADHRQLERWLKGFDLPPFGSQEPYFRWVVRSLDSEEATQQKTLAARLSRLLTELDSHADDPLFPTLAENAVALAATLSAPTFLADPLFNLYMALAGGRLNLQDSTKALLLNALIENQRDDRLVNTWTTLLSNEQCILPGNVIDGFDGMRLMPPGASDDLAGTPALPYIGVALQQCCCFLEEVHERRGEFRKLVLRLLDTYPGRPSWFSDLVYTAHSCSWPRWAVESLPFISVDLICDPVSRLPTEVLLLKPIAACIPKDYHTTLLEELCAKTYVRLLLDSDAGRAVQRLVPLFLVEHQWDCGPSERAFSTEILAAMSRAKQDALARNDLPLERGVRVAHHAVLAAIKQQSSYEGVA
jgi:hypothetical protein